MTTLFTLVDGADPYGPGLAGRDQWAGPVLTLVGLRAYERVILFEGPDEEGRAKATAEALAGRCTVERVALPSTGVREFLCAWWTRWRVAHPDDPAVACVNAGPSSLRGLWWALADTIDLVEVSRPEFIGDTPAGVRAVSVAAPVRRSFVAREPAVAYRVETDPDAYERGWRGRNAGGGAGGPPPTLEQALRQLGLCGQDPAFERAVATAATLAPHKVPVLLGGETGSGKGAMARLIHLLSGRPADRWVTLNGAALPENLAESILFGHQKGAFTGAACDQAGKFEVADRGTLFLDEVGELSLTVQAKLLKVLEDGVVEPVGARQGKPVDVRVIAATNRDLSAAVAAKTFREDLFYRLSFARLAMPSLRERRSDIPQLALHLVGKINRSLREPRRLAPSALLRLEQHRWPGNIRELENVIGRSLLLSTREVLEAGDLLFDAPAAVTADPLQQLPTPCDGFSLESYLSDARRQLILRALEMTGGNQSAASRLLGVSPQAVHKFLSNPG